ncbi:MAG: DUF4167 domain-containing protein [Pseudomonadota bacterium]
MRPGQSNKRSRGRGRKGPSPLSRSHESNGPDVKIRGTAQHIADKYINLARDAQSSGDAVLSEAYLQHAEHYYRIVAAAQQQMNQPVNVKRADDPIEAEESNEREDQEGYDPSAPDAPQPDAMANGRGRDGDRRDNERRGDDEDGDRRGRRGRGRGRRGRGDEGAPNAPAAESGDAGQASGPAAASGDNETREGADEGRPRRGSRPRRANVDVADRFDGDAAPAAQPESAGGNGSSTGAAEADSGNGSEVASAAASEPSNDVPAGPPPVAGDDATSAPSEDTERP